MRLLPLLLFVFLSCSGNVMKQGQELLMISPDNYSSTELELTDIIDTVRFIQLDDSVIIAGLRNIFIVNNFLFGFNPKHGIMKYEITGRLIQMIGRIGDGPDEYQACGKLAVDKTNEILYIYSPPDILLSYSFTGKLLNRVHVQFPNKEFEYYPDYFCVQNGQLCFFYNNCSSSRKEICYWLIANKDGHVIIVHKGPSSYVKEDKYVTYYNYYSMVNDSTTIYWDLFNDTIFHVSAYQSKAAYLWDKGDFRLLKTDDLFNPPRNHLRCNQVFETDNYLLLSFGRLSLPFDSYWILYNKKTGSFNKLSEELTYDKKHNLSLGHKVLNMIRWDGRDYLMFREKTANVECISGALRWGTDPEDPEGNPVWVLIRLKE